MLLLLLAQRAALVEEDRKPVIRPRLRPICGAAGPQAARAPDVVESSRRRASPSPPHGRRLMLLLMLWLLLLRPKSRLVVVMRRWPMLMIMQPCASQSAYALRSKLTPYTDDGACLNWNGLDEGLRCDTMLMVRCIDRSVHLVPSNYHQSIELCRTCD